MLNRLVVLDSNCYYGEAAKVFASLVCSSVYRLSSLVIMLYMQLVGSLKHPIVLHIHVLLLYIILTDSGFEANSFSILGLIQLDDSVEPAPSSAPPSGDPPSGMYACTKWMAPW